MESDNLFSLEIFIENIQNLKVECGIPAVAFRFLDYPTLLVYYTELDVIDSINKKLESKCIRPDDVLKNLCELQTNNNGYDFNKGKSCLFRQTWNRLRRLLAQIPLYVTLVDCLRQGGMRKEPGVLGVASLPLLQLVENVEGTRTSPHDDSPVTVRKATTIKLFNLMGTQIGVLNLSVKLTCYGSSLLRHVTVEEKTDSHINIFLKNLSLREDRPEAALRKTVREEKNDISPIREIIPPDGKSISTKIQQCEKFSQTKRRKTKKVKRHVKETIYTEEVHIEKEHDNMFRPPPLFLNLRPTQNHTVFEKRTDEYKDDVIRKSRFLTDTKFQEYTEDSSTVDDDDDDDDCDPIIERLFPVGGSVYTLQNNSSPSKTRSYFDNPAESTRRNIEQSFKKADEDKELNQDSVSLGKLKSTIPILCSLVSEIAKFNDILNGDKKKQGMPQKESSSNDRVGEKETRDECVKLKQEEIEIGNRNVENRKKNFHEKPGKYKDRKKHHTNKKTRGNKKLSYGLTRTQRLRYAITHGGVELPHVDEDVDEDVNEEEKVDEINLSSSREFDGGSELTCMNSRKDTEEKESKISPYCVDAAVQTSVEKITSQTSIHREMLERQSESQVGFHSPVEPRHISPSELFDDNRPWSSNQSFHLNPSPANQIESFENSANQKPSLQSNKCGAGYSDESFASSGTISGTSSVSLPQVSFTASSSPLKMDDTIRNSSARSLKSDPRRSVQSTEQRRSSTTLKLSSKTSYRENALSYESQKRSDRSSNSSSKNSQRKSPFIASSTFQNSNKEEGEIINSDSSIGSRASEKSNSGNSIHLNRDLENSVSSYDRGSPDYPKQSSQSPMKSKFQKRVVPNQQNVLNVTIPTAGLLGTSVQTTVSFPDSNSEL